MSGLVDAVMAHMSPDNIAAIASQLGTDPAQAQAAIEHAVPLIVGGIANNASAPGGADVLHNVLTQDHSGVDIGGLLSGMLNGSGGNTAATSMGGAILGHIFGANQTAANSGLGQVTGLGQQSAGQLMAILAPIIMAQLGHMTQNQNLSPGGLGSVLGQASQQIQQQGSLGGGLLQAVLGHTGGNLDLSHLVQQAGGLLNMFTRH